MSVSFRVPMVQSHALPACRCQRLCKSGMHKKSVKQTYVIIKGHLNSGICRYVPPHIP